MPLESPMLPPVRYVLTSAIITSPGVYRYQLVSIKEARAWLTHGPWVSRVGYPQIARYIARTLGCIVSSRGTSRSCAQATKGWWSGSHIDRMTPQTKHLNSCSSVKTGRSGC